MFQLSPRGGALVAAFGFVLAAGCTQRETSHGTPPVQAALPLQGPQVVQDMVAAHGGLEAWRAAPTVTFRDEFQVPGQPAQASRVVVEQTARRAYLDMPDSSTIAWDGSQAWSTNWKSPLPPRFLALLNYYFLNLPWLTQDTGVKLAEPAKGTLPGDPTEYVTVMMTFGAGVGDTPRDYYRLYIDPVRKRLKGCAYVITYKALLPEGMTASPEHLLVYDEMATVGGLVVPTRYTIYENDAVYATCTVRDWAFGRPFDAGRMAMPAGAVIDTSTP